MSLLRNRSGKRRLSSHRYRNKIRNRIKRIPKRQIRNLSQNLSWGKPHRANKQSKPPMNRSKVNKKDPTTE